MSEPAESTTTYKTEIIWMLSEEEIASIRQHDEAGTRCYTRKNFKDSAWYLSFDSLHPGSQLPYVYLGACPLAEDLKLASTSKSWAREGSYTWTVSLVIAEPDPAVETEQMDITKEFDKNCPSWGKPLKVTAKKLLQMYDKKKSFGFRFSLEHDHLPQPRSPAFKTLLRLFDNQHYADTVFLIHGRAGQASHIFACETILTANSSYFQLLFESGFAEATSQKKRDISSFLPGHPDRPMLASAARDDMVPFTPPTSTCTSPAGTAGIRSPSSTLCSVATEVDLVTEGDERKKLSDKNESDCVKCCKIVDIYETDYLTYRAMLAYLHTTSTPFFYDPIHLLLKLDLLDLQSPALFDSQLQRCLEEVTASAKAHPLWEGVEPASCHAMYRLADRYSLEELREMSLGYIVRSLSVETAAYTLFSPLSLDYDSVQQPFLEFFLEHWEKVKVTKGFERVLEKFSSGELPKGKDLITAIFKKMKAS